MHSRLCHLRLPPSRPTSPASPSLELTLTAANKFTKNSPQKNKNTDLQKNVLRFTQICKKKLLYKIAKNSRSRATRAQETETKQAPHTTAKHRTKHGTKSKDDEKHGTEHTRHSRCQIQVQFCCVSRNWVHVSVLSFSFSFGEFGYFQKHSISPFIPLFK
jgi:hypothetical protein